MLLQSDLISIGASLSAFLSAIVCIVTVMIAKRKMRIETSIQVHGIKKREQEKTKYLSHPVMQKDEATLSGADIREVEGIDIRSNRKDIRKRVSLAAEVFDRYGDEIRAIISHNVKNKSQAEDIFKNFFVSIVRKPLPTDIQDVKKYLYRSVTNEVIDATRRTKKRRNHIQKYAERKSYTIIRDDLRELIVPTEECQKALDLVGRRVSSSIIQKYGYGLSTDETAK